MKLKFLALVIVLISSSCFGQDVLKTCKVWMNCKLNLEPTPGTAIETITKGESVQVVDIISGYYKVKYKNKEGYVNNLFIRDDELSKLTETRKQKAKEEAKKRKEILDQERKELEEQKQKELVEKFGEVNLFLISINKVKVGMTKEAVIMSWGRPMKINKTKFGLNVREQWVYSGYRYLYFEHGRLKTIQD